MRLYVLLLLAAVGCGGGGGGNGDDVTVTDAQGANDAPAPQNGLLVTWTANPALPGTLKTDLTVTSATFKIAHLQVIGDNGQPMTQQAFELSWSTGEVFPNPPAQLFTAAPAGLYSQVTLDIDEQLLGTCYEIFGTAKVGGVTKQFHIHDRNSLDVDVKDYAITLLPGDGATMAVRIDLKDAIDAIEFDMLSEDNGVLDLDTGDSQMDDFRSELKKAFKKGP